MNTRAQIIGKIEAYLTRTGMTERRFGLDVMGDHKFLRRLRDGAGITLTNVERAERFMAQHPDGPGPQLAKSA